MSSSNTKIIDLSKENSASLESVSDDILVHWKESGKKGLLIGLGLVIVLVLLNLIVFSLDPNGIVVIISLILSLALLFAAVYNLISAGKKFFSNPRLAAETPEESLIRFFDACIMTLYIKNINKIGVIPIEEAFLCLLNQAKEQSGDLEGFEEKLEKDSSKFWEEIKQYYDKLIKDDLIHLPKDNVGFTEVSIIINKTESLDDKNDIKYYVTYFDLIAYTGIGGSSYYPKKEIGRNQLKVEKQVVNINGLFYLTDADCNWIIIK